MMGGACSQAGLDFGVEGAQSEGGHTSMLAMLALVVSPSPLTPLGNQSMRFRCNP